MVTTSPVTRIVSESPGRDEPAAAPEPQAPISAAPTTTDSPSRGCRRSGRNGHTQRVVESLERLLELAGAVCRRHERRLVRRRREGEATLTRRVKDTPKESDVGLLRVGEGARQSGPERRNPTSSPHGPPRTARRVDAQSRRSPRTSSPVRTRNALVQRRRQRRVRVARPAAIASGLPDSVPA